MGEQFHSLIDVTIVYPHGAPSFWEVISRGLPEVVVRVRELPVPVEWFTGDYAEDSAFREGVHAWVRTLFREKDEEITAILASRAPSSGPPVR